MLAKLKLTVDQFGLFEHWFLELVNEVSWMTVSGQLGQFGERTGFGFYKGAHRVLLLFMWVLA
jgi:hypothetical protein